MNTTTSPFSLKTAAMHFATAAVAASLLTGCESDGPIPPPPAAHLTPQKIVVTDPGRPTPPPAPTQTLPPARAPVPAAATPDPAQISIVDVRVAAAPPQPTVITLPPVAQQPPTPIVAAPTITFPQQPPAPQGKVSTSPMGITLPPAALSAQPLPVQSPAITAAVIAPPAMTPAAAMPAGTLDPAAIFDQQLARVVSGQAAPVAADLTALPKEDQELISATIDAVNNFRSRLKTSPTGPAETKAQPLVELGKRAQGVSGFSVPTIRMTSRILSFGSYDPMPEQISPNRLTPTALYAEVAGFSSRQINDGIWETRLVMSLTLYGSDNNIVWQHEPEQFPDRCRNRRTDFFVVSKVNLPALPAGNYTLKATLSDTLASRVAEANLPIMSR